MKKKEEEDQELEIIKAVAQAWHGHSGNPRPMKELDAQRNNNHQRCSSRPSRFKLEAMNMAMSKEMKTNARWDFQQSLWDSYELVTLSKKLESGLVMDHPIECGPQDTIRKRPRESKNSLRSFIGRISSKRYDPDVFHKGDGFSSG